MGKAFTAFSVGLMVDEGRMSFDTPVRAYLPGFSMHDPVASQQVTLRDMMSHRTGLPRHDALWYHNNELTRDGFLERLPYLESSAPLRARFQYNNWMFTLSGLAVERVAGQRWETVVETRIFQPLGMTRTTFDNAEVLADADRIQGTVFARGRRVTVPFYFDQTDTLNPAGGIISTAHDTGLWLAMQTAGGVHNGQVVIQPSTLAQMHTTQMSTGATPPHPALVPTGYGLGWGTEVYRGMPSVQHGGNLPGVSTRQTLVPSMKLGIVVLVNHGGSELPALLSRTLIDRFAGLEPIDWTAQGLTRKRASEASTVAGREGREALRVAGTRPSHALTDYAGVYEHPGYGQVTVTLDGGALTGRFNADSSPLAHWHYDTFEATTDDPDNVLTDAQVQFLTDTRGRIDRIVIPLESALPPIILSKAPEARLSDPAYLATLSGTYDLNAVPVVVSVSGGKLIWTQRGGVPVQLQPALGGEFFNPRSPETRFRFVTGPGGRVTGAQAINSRGVFDIPRTD
jgi:CubicO group peptidase (beta-lactamase class C family)